MDALETNQNADTPESQGSEQLSVEQAFFTSEEQASNEAVGTPETQETPAGDGINVEDTQAKNDERRYQYWQSEKFRFAGNQLLWIDIHNWKHYHLHQDILQYPLRN